MGVREAVLDRGASALAPLSIEPCTKRVGDLPPGSAVHLESAAPVPTPARQMGTTRLHSRGLLHTGVCPDSP